MLSAREELIEKTCSFLDSIKNKTPGAELEDWLNSNYGPGTSLYEALARLVKQGVQEGWLAVDYITGLHYRRSRLLEPSDKTNYFSVTTVYMDSGEQKNRGSTMLEQNGLLRGDYHLHPYGEINLVVPLELDACLKGPRGWKHKGWTVLPPGSHHYPEVKGGALIAFFFLPSGRLSYDIKAEDQSAIKL